jgi:hypothetical protein
LLFYPMERESILFFKELYTLIHILDESPFFMELPLKDKEALMKDLLRSYPQLIQQSDNDPDIGWFAQRFLK